MSADDGRPATTLTVGELLDDLQGRGLPRETPILVVSQRTWPPPASLDDELASILGNACDAEPGNGELTLWLVVGVDEPIPNGNRFGPGRMFRLGDVALTWPSEVEP